MITGRFLSAFKRNRVYRIPNLHPKTLQQQFPSKLSSRNFPASASGSRSKVVKMAFFGKVGNILRQASSRQISSEFSVSKPSLYQAVRCMSSKLFVGGLSYGTDEQSLREAFTKYGDVIEARIIQDRETGRSRGFGFVTFTSSEEASSAIQALDGQDLHGRRVRVNYATERAPRPNFYDNNAYGGGGGGGYNNYGGNNYASGGSNYGSGGGGGWGNDSASGGNSAGYNPGNYGSGNAYGSSGGNDASSENQSNTYGGSSYASSGNPGNYNNPSSFGDGNTYGSGGSNYGSGGNLGSFNNPSTYGDANTYGGGNSGSSSNFATNGFDGSTGLGYGNGNQAGNSEGSINPDGGFDAGSGLEFGSGNQFGSNESSTTEVGDGSFDQVGPLEGNFRDEDEPADDYAKRA